MPRKPQRRYWISVSLLQLAGIIPQIACCLHSQTESFEFSPCRKMKIKIMIAAQCLKWCSGIFWPKPWSSRNGLAWASHRQTTCGLSLPSSCLRWLLSSKNQRPGIIVMLRKATCPASLLCKIDWPGKSRERTSHFEFWHNCFSPRANVAAKIRLVLF